MVHRSGDRSLEGRTSHDTGHGSMGTPTSVSVSGWQCKRTERVASLPLPCPLLRCFLVQKHQLRASPAQDTHGDQPLYSIRVCPLARLQLRGDKKQFERLWQEELARER